MLRPDDLVGLPDFSLGALTVSPSRRVVERDGETLAVEPRVMQVLVLLAREPGVVVTRQRLFDDVWGGVPVGEDSLNRAVAGARRALALDPGNLTLETIPRTGYRLLVKSDDRPGSRSFSRRGLIGAGAGIAAVGGLGLWFLDARDDREFDLMMRRGLDSLAYYDRGPNVSQYFRRAAALRPEDARAQGLLAYSQAMRTENASANRQGALQEAERATGAALALDPAQPEAQLAQILLQRSMLDYATTEQRLGAVLTRNPRNPRALRQLWELFQCVGRSRDALGLVELALAVAPLSATNHFPRAQLLWINGRVAEADRVIDRAMDYWPTHPFVRFARFTIFAFTDRPRAALAMLDKPGPRPAFFPDSTVDLLRVTLTALDQRTPRTIAAATSASLDAYKRDPQISAQAVMALSALGQVDAAFEIADTMFVTKGATAGAGAGTAQPVRGTSWRFAPWLFTPPMAAMWVDPRIGRICDAAGLTEYWAKRGVRPDYQLAVA